MAVWKGSGGSEVGQVVAQAGGTKSYLPSRRIALPSTRETLTAAVNTALYAVGTDADGNDIVVWETTGTSVLEVGGIGETPDYSVDLNDGLDNGVAAYPTTLKNMIDSTEGGDADTIYDPRDGLVHEGLVVMACRVHDYNTGTRTVAASWDQQNRVSLVWKNIGDAAWSVVDDDPAANAGPLGTVDLGSVWMLGTPILPDADTLLLGWANYQDKAAGNAENRAYVSKFTRTGSAWSHDSTVEIYSDAARTDEQHFHSVALDWDGSRLRALLFVGDGMNDNGVIEIHRADLDIADDATTKTGYGVRDATASSSWDRHGYVQGGATNTNTSSGTNYPDGIQPTWAIALGGRLHLGADEASPAIYSADVSGAAESALTDLRTEFLGLTLDRTTGSQGFASLVADCDDYADPTRAVALVAPTLDYTNDGNVTRIAYYDGTGWSTVGQVDSTNTSGLGLTKSGRIIVPTGSGLVQVTPGAADAYTPIVSSVAAVNEVDGATVGTAVASRVTASVVSDLVAEGISLPEGIDPNVTVHKFAFNSASTAGATFARVSMAAGNQAVLSGAPAFQFRAWARAIAGPNTAALRFAPKAIGSGTSGAGDFLMQTANGSATSVYINDGWSRLTTHDWVEVFGTVVVTETITGSYGLMLQLDTRITDGAYAEPDIYFILEGLYDVSSQRVLQRPDQGDATGLAGTDLAVDVSAASLPLTVAGVTHPSDAGHESPYLKNDDLLFRLWKDADNYLDLHRDVTNSRVALSGSIGGSAYNSGTPTSLGTVEWSRETPVSVRFERDGADLTVRASTYANPYGSATTVAGGGLDWGAVRLYDGTDQGVLALALVDADAGGSPRSVRAGAGGGRNPRAVRQGP